MVKNVADGKIKWWGNVDFDTLRLNQTAISKHKATGAETVLNDSVFDVLVKSLDEVTTLSSKTDAEFLLSSLRAQKDNKVSMISLRAMFGELEAIKSIKSAPEYNGATLKQVNNRVDIELPDGRQYYNVQGVDSVWDLSDGRTLYVESKNWAFAGTRAERLEGMKKQFKKHISANIGQHISSGPNASGKIVPKWSGDKVPVLQYELRGSYFRDSNSPVKTSADDIRNEFKAIIEDKTESDLNNLRELLGHGTPQFETKLNQFLKIKDYDEVISPLSS